eukprot:2632188-Alexandrium_andersonii.AAC.1
MREECSSDSARPDAFFFGEEHPCTAEQLAVGTSSGSSVKRESAKVQNDDNVIARQDFEQSSSSMDDQRQ